MINRRARSLAPHSPARATNDPASPSTLRAQPWLAEHLLCLQDASFLAAARRAIFEDVSEV